METKKGRVKKFDEWVAGNEPQPSILDEVAMPNGISPAEIASLDPFTLAKKVKGMPRPRGVGPFPYAMMLKTKQRGIQ